MAQYPATVPTFTTKHNITDVVDEGDPNSERAEITAIGQELGTLIKTSLARSVTYADLKARLEAIETDYRLLTAHDSHAALTGLAGDDHTQYTRVDGSRAFTGSTAITAAPVAVQAGDTQSQGALHTLARSDHRHAFATAAAGASAVGDAAGAGTATTHARSDHVHGRESFGAVTAAITTGIAAANGSAASVARSDHTHGTPALTATAPVTQAVGDAAAVGVGTDGARNDHRHGMPAFGAVTSALTHGIAAANGSAATLARSDHQHGTPTLATAVTDERTWGIAPVVGTSDKAAREDHTHGSPDPTLMGPTGTICMFPNATPPTGWLLCDGASYLRATYAALFTALGGAASPWGLPDGTHFNVPDIKGRVVVGSMGTGSGLTSRALAAKSGEETHVLTLAESAWHYHTVNSHSHSGGTDWRAHSHSTSGVGDHRHMDDIGFRYVITYGGTQNERLMTWAAGNAVGVTFTDHRGAGGHGHDVYGDGNHQHGIGAEAPGTDAQGGNGAHNNMQPWVAMPYIIKY